MSEEADELWRSFVESRLDEFDLEAERAAVAEAALENPRRLGVVDEVRTIAEVDVLVARPEAGARTDLVVVWIHGGAFTVMRADSYRALAGHLAGELGAEVYVPDFTLAPEAVFPQALDELERCIGEIVGDSADRAEVLVGDSAGAALTLGVMKRRRARNEAMPLLAALQCPWLDLSLQSPSLTRNAPLDAVLGAAPLADHVAWYLGADTGAEDPIASPLHGDLAGLGAIAIQAAEYDVLADDALRFTRKARDAGVAVDLEMAAEMPHGYQFFVGMIPEADGALAALARRIEQQLSARQVDSTA
ncbi:MAG: alpha/beta hydrolase fold domain-containing protein [Actinomycetota bacterium]